MQYQRLTDHELIALYLDGHETAFEQLLLRHKDRIYTAIYMLVKDADKANDIFQDTFIKIIDTLRGGRYHDDGRFINWATRIAHNLCIDYFRRGKRLPGLVPAHEAEHVERVHCDEDNALQQIMQHQLQVSLRQLVDRLPPEQREVVVLRHYADMSFKEIADITQVSINTALGRMRYALINIRKMMVENEIFLR